MSGIAGIIHFDGAPVAPGLVEAMTSTMAHRGPDGIAHWSKGMVALGQCMLRTTPESLEEHQPLANEEAGLVLVMDGRVDNWEELRRELLGCGAALRDRSDAELVLRAYETWGRECLAHIDGDFAWVIWDARRQEVFCARDRMGHKPFHYHWDGKTFAFASDLRAILALPWVRQTPNTGLLAEFLAAQWRSRDETLWTGILRLMAAHQMVVDGRGPRLESYWEPDLWAALPFRKDEEYAEYHRELLANAVRRLSRSHSPVAFEVSGGLDSSAIFCMAEHLRRAGKMLTPRIEGYTLAFTEKDDEAYELSYACAVGEYLGIQIHEIPPTRMPPSEFTERARADRDFPAFPNWTMFTGIYRQVAAQGSCVLLNGFGGDQWMQGSRAYYAEELAQRHWLTLLDCFRADVSAFGVRQAMAWLARYGFIGLLSPASQDILRRLVRKLRGDPPPRAGYYWLSPPMREILQPRLDLIQPQCKRLPKAGQNELLTGLYHPISAHAMEWSERLASRSGIELRHPLDDPKIVQYAFSTPARLWLRGSRTKSLHVRALQEIMPSITLERESKADFMVVLYEYLEQMQETLTETLPGERGAWVAQEGMRRLFQACRNDYPAANWWIWSVWAIHGCDGVYRQ